MSREQVSNLVENAEYKNALMQLKEASLSGELQQVEETAERLESVLQNILEVKTKKFYYKLYIY